MLPWISTLLVQQCAKYSLTINSFNSCYFIFLFLRTNVLLKKKAIGCLSQKNENIYSCRSLYTNVHSSFINICNSPRLETSHISFIDYKVKRIVGHPSMVYESVIKGNKLFIHGNKSEKSPSQKVIGLPWWRSGWESACQCRGHGFEPWSVKIPHAAEQQSPWATTTEPARLEPVLHNKRGRDSERPMHRDEEWPPLAATRESPRTETKTQHSQK